MISPMPLHRMLESDISLRPAAETDREFLRRVQREAMRPHVERLFGAWDDAFQRERFDATTDPSTHEIIAYGGNPVGCQWVGAHADSLELVRLYLLPEAQGSGIGTKLVQRLLTRAQAQDLPVQLRVIRENPARRLYERLGFRVVAETETHFLMRHPGSV